MGGRSCYKVEGGKNKRKEMISCHTGPGLKGFTVLSRMVDEASGTKIQM